MPRPEMSKPLDICVEEDPVNPTVRDTEQDRSERRAFAIEDHRRLAVELVLLDLQGSRPRLVASTTNLAIPSGPWSGTRRLRRPPTLLPSRPPSVISTASSASIETRPLTSPA
jgi:hypothetical protein